MELERFSKEEWKNNNRCAKLEALYSKRLEAVIAVEGALTKYKVKAVSAFINVIFMFLFVINLQEFCNMTQHVVQVKHCGYFPDSLCIVLTLTFLIKKKKKKI